MCVCGWEERKKKRDGERTGGDGALYHLDGVGYGN